MQEIQEKRKYKGDLEENNSDENEILIKKIAQIMETNFSILTPIGLSKR